MLMAWRLGLKHLMTSLVKPQIDLMEEEIP
jgi:hypothetical protein